MSDTSDFGKILDQHLARLQTRVRVGQKVKGRITAVDEKTVFVDIDAPSEALLDRVELLDEKGELRARVGDTVEGVCTRDEDGDVRISLKATGAAHDAALEDAYVARVPVEGRVAGEIKGGFEVVVGNARGFCPYSQMDLGKQEAGVYIGQKFLFRITKFGRGGRDLTLNRRALLQEEADRRREELRQMLKVGDQLTGTVRRLMPFGVFVDLGGVDGLVPVSELGWRRGLKPEDVVSPGQSVTVTVREIDWERGRISLSLKSAADDPWQSATARFLLGAHHRGVVTRLMPFGAFVELEPGIEGLLPISRLGGGRRLRDPGEVLKEGEAVDVTVEGLDAERRRISLALAQAEPAGPAAAAGERLKAVVESVKEFGVFLKLADGRSGLLHVRELGLPSAPTRMRALLRDFPPGKEVEVVVRAVEGSRVSLTLPATLEREQEQAEANASLAEHANTAPALGSLGSLLNLDPLGPVADKPSDE